MKTHFFTAQTPRVRQLQKCAAGRMEELQDHCAGYKMIASDSRSVVDLPAFSRDHYLHIMDLNKLRRYESITAVNPVEFIFEVPGPKPSPLGGSASAGIPSQVGSRNQPGKESAQPRSWAPLFSRWRSDGRNEHAHIEERDMPCFSL